ncbi:MAG: NADH:ubiquinone reductase (Na(+)-transporting) subunit C [Flavobacteriales bacterium]|nr:NADH:ubiquinone reductase (Na(+)-transporting) subunit C [Flavobacteriales bacterium]
MNKEGSTYTFMFAGIMVVVVATILSVAAISLKPFQERNQMHEKMQNILQTIGIEATMDEAPALFDKYVKKRVVLDHSGSGQPVSENVGNIDAKDKKDGFNIDVRKEYKSLSEDQRNYPLFICETDKGSFTVIPMVGTGLWGPIWGFVALKEDLSTVYGTSFDHHGETPGLGAEIKTPAFQAQFVDKKIFEGNELASIHVVKGGAKEGDVHGVDAITGGTVTSTGVDEMISRTLKVYETYLKNNKQ